MFFGQVDDTAFYESKGSLWGYKTVLTIICLFHLSIADNERIDQGFFWKTIGRVVKIPYHVSKGIYSRIFLEKDLFLFHHWALSEFFLSFRRKFVGPVVRTAFCMSIRSVCCEKTFVQTFFLQSYLEIDRKFIGLCSKFFQPSWRLSFLRVRKINLKTNNCSDKHFYLFFHPSLTLNEKKWFFWRETISRFVKPAYDLSRQSVEKLFCPNRFFFCSSLTLDWFSFWLFDKNFSAVSSKLLCVCPLQQFVVKKFSVKNVFLPLFLDIQRNFVSCFRNFSG